MTLKGQIREEVLKILSNLDTRWCKAAGKGVCQNLLKLIDRDLGSSYEHILAWVPILKGEVDLSPLIAEISENKHVYLPRVISNEEVRFIEIGDFYQDSPGIIDQELDTGKMYELKLAEQTVILVPGIAFDMKGGRLGRARHNYNKFLKLPKMKDAIRVGVCWSSQIYETLPDTDDTISMHWVCTEKECLKIE